MKENPDKKAFVAEEETPEPPVPSPAVTSSFASLSKLTGLAAGQEPTDTSIFEGKILGKANYCTFFSGWAPILMTIPTYADTLSCPNK